MTKYVVTTTLDELEWNNSIPIKGDVAEEVWPMVFPVVLGSGKRLFPKSPEKIILQLVDTKTFETGVQVNTYRPAGREPQAA